MRVLILLFISISVYSQNQPSRLRAVDLIGRTFQLEGGDSDCRDRFEMTEQLATNLDYMEVQFSVDRDSDGAQWLIFFHPGYESRSWWRGDIPTHSCQYFEIDEEGHAIGVNDSNRNTTPESRRNRPSGGPRRDSSTGY